MSFCFSFAYAAVMMLSTGFICWSYDLSERTGCGSGWQRYQRLTQECYRCRNQTNAVMQP